MRIGRCVTDGVGKGEKGGKAEGPLTECNQEGGRQDGDCWCFRRESLGCLCYELGSSYRCFKCHLKVSFFPIFQFTPEGPENRIAQNLTPSSGSVDVWGNVSKHPSSSSMLSSLGWDPHSVAGPLPGVTFSLKVQAFFSSIAANKLLHSLEAENTTFLLIQSLWCKDAGVALAQGLCGSR